MALKLRDSNRSGLDHLTVPLTRPLEQLYGYIFGPDPGRRIVKELEIRFSCSESFPMFWTPEVELSIR